MTRRIAITILRWTTDALEWFRDGLLRLPMGMRQGVFLAIAGFVVFFVTWMILGGFVTVAHDLISFARR